MPLEKTSDVCKVCGETRDGKPGLYCAVCRKEHNKLSMRNLRKGFSEEKVKEIKEKDLEKKRLQYQANPEIFRERLKRQREDKGFIFYHDRVRKYKISICKYLSILETQRHKCAICFVAESGGKGTWHIDHDHKTGLVRGLLCHYCNTALGAFKESKSVLQAAISYLTNSTPV